MTPKKLAKESEHSQQVAVFAYCAVAYLHGFDAADAWSETGKLPQRDPSTPPAVPALEWVHAIPNGGARGDDEQTRKIRGGNLKAEGVRQGVADIFLPWPVFERREYDDMGNPCDVTEVKWCGLYIEMKKPSLRPKSDEAKGGLSDDQIAFGAYAKNVGYGWAVCYDWQQAVAYLRSYIGWGSK